jgi:hypothetical protein
MIFRRWRWLLLDLVLVSLASAAGIGLVREVVEGRPLPPPPVTSESSPHPAAPDDSVPAATDQTGAAPEQYRVVAAGNLFAASRGTAAAIVAVPAGVKLLLHGVVIDGDRSRAYLDDPVAKRVFGYAVGDSVAGGRLERILDDRVLIRGSDGLVEILLQDPAKPQSTEPAVAAAAPTRGRRSGPRSAPETPAPQSPAPESPGPAPVPGQVPR